MIVDRRVARRRGGTACFLAAAVAGACAAAQPYVIEVPQPRARVASDIRDIADYERATATVASIFERVLRFRPFPVSLVFYPGARAFETALVASGHDAAMARATAETMSGIGGYRRVLLNAQVLEPQPWAGRVAVLAHEMTHSLQYELGGGTRGASDQWLREGFAEWVAVRVLEELNATTYEEYKRQHASLWRASRRARAPSLDELATFPQWVALSDRRDIAPYSQAFLAVDLLIRQRGAGAVLRYFERFAARQDRLGNFRAAFGEDLAAFEVRLAEHLRK